MRGEVVHQWDHPLVVGSYGYLLESGKPALVWEGFRKVRSTWAARGRGCCGNMAGTAAWCGSTGTSANITIFRRLPNGNTIFLAWEVVPPEIEGRVPGGLPRQRAHGRRLHVRRLHLRNPSRWKGGLGVACVPRTWQWKIIRSVRASIATSSPMPTRSRRCPMATS